MVESQGDYERGMRLLEAGALGDALAPLSEAMKKTPGNETIARALMRLGRSAIQAALGMSSDDAATLDLYRCGLDAYRALDATVSSPTDLGLLRVAFFNLGCSSHRANQHDEAIRYYSDALTIEPRAEDTAVNLAIVLCSCGRDAEALDVIDRGLRYHPGSLQLQQKRKELKLGQAGGAG